MLRLLRLISYPQLRASWGRTALVVGGIATGVSLIVAINIINTSVLANFRNTIELMAGPAALEVTLGVGEIGFDESTVETIRGDPDVLAAVPLVRGTVALADGSGEALQLFGTDLTAEEVLQRYHVTTANRQEVLRGLADPRSILLTERLARRHAIDVGDTIRLATLVGFGDFTIRGLLETAGLAAAFGGQLAVMDLPAAQRVLAKENLVDQIDVVLRDGADVSVVRGRLAAALPAILTVARPQQRGEQYERIFRAFQAMLTGLSTLCLVAGVFIIYNTTSTGAVRRAAVMGGLRLIGADESRLFRLLMLEALVLGAIGAVLGIGSGIVLAHALTDLVSDSMGVIFQLRFPVQRLQIEPTQQAAIAVIGLAAALFASYFAARRASRVEPLEVVRSTVQPTPASPAPGPLVAWWVVMVTMSGAALALQAHLQSFVWGNIGSTLWNASVLVIAVPVVGWARGILSPLLPRAFGAEGRMAAESLYRSRTRTGITVAAVALVLALAITVSTLATSFRRSVGSYAEAGGFLAGDLVVSAVATEGGWLETPLPADLAASLAALPGVHQVETWRIVFGQMYRGERIALFGLSDGFLTPSLYGPHWYIEGDAARAAEALRRGQGVNLAAALADRFDLHVGARITLDSPTGPVSLPIVGIVRDYLSDRGTIVLGRRLLAERWGKADVSRFHVFLEPGASSEQVRERIARELGRQHLLKVLSLREVVDYQAHAIDRAFAFTGAIQLLIVIVTIAGILDLLLAAIVERRRELALWRVIGADDRAVRRSIVVESGTIGGLGVLLGIAVGFVTAWIWIGFNFRHLLGFALEYHLPLGAVAWYVILVMAMTIVSGYGAAFEATRQPVLDGIQIE